MLVHDRAAVAWHDEPDRAERDGSAIDQTAETLWLAANIPEPAARSAAVTYEHADTIAVLELADRDVGPLVATIASVIEGFGDVAVHVVSAAPPAVVDHFAFDRRVRFAAPTLAQQQRCRAMVTIRRPVADAADRLRDVLAQVRPGGVGTVRVTSGGEEIITVSSTRAMGRLRRAVALGAPVGTLVAALGEASFEADAVGLAPAAGAVDLQATFGGW